MFKYALLLLASAFAGTVYAQTYTWNKLTAAPYVAAKQDDVFFINPDTGWSVNGTGKIYKTTDGGSTWTTLITQTGTFFRCIQFIDAQVGFAGNIGPDYFPGVTDTIPLYKTTDGGTNWAPVTYSGPKVKGLCAISAVGTPYIKSGILDTNYTIYAAGRVGGPSFLLKSSDNGDTWTATDLNAYIGMITDVKFLSKDTGFVFGGSSGDISVSNTKIIYTTDGGSTWTTVYQSTRSIEAIWKAHFPSRKTGYATVLSYNTGTTQRYVAKTTDGGLTWTELPFTNDGCKEFGIGFADDKTGWVGTDNMGGETTDGGLTWSPRNIGRYANKIRIIHKPAGFVGYAIGLDLYKLSYEPSAGIEQFDLSAAFKAYPNPGSGIITIQYAVTARRKVVLEVYDLTGKRISSLVNEVQDPGDKRIDYPCQNLPAGILLLKLQVGADTYSQQVNLRP